MKGLALHAPAAERRSAQGEAPALRMRLPPVRSRVGEGREQGCAGGMKSQPWVYATTCGGDASVNHGQR